MLKIKGFSSSYNLQVTTGEMKRKYIKKLQGQAHERLK